MLKSLIWGSDTPVWEEEVEERPQQQSQDASCTESQQDPRAHLPTNRRQQPQPTTANGNHDAQRPFSSLRRTYTLARVGRLAGPLSVNDPELQKQNFKTSLPDEFFALPCPIDRWIAFRDSVVHVHQLLRAMVAGQDYAGAARALAVLHRLHGAFDPDVYRYTATLLRVSGDHTKTMMYFRKLVGIFLRTASNRMGYRHTVVIQDYLAYLCDTQEYKEAVNMIQSIPFTKGRKGRGIDPSLQAYGTVLHLFASLLEHQQISLKSSPAASSSPSGVKQIAGEEASPPSSLPLPPSARIPDLQDPLALIGPLRACLMENTGGGGGDGFAALNPNADAHRARALAHIKEAEKLANLATERLPWNASAAGYRAAIEAAKRGPASALRQLENFIERNADSVKGRALHSRLLEMDFGDSSALNNSSEEREAAATSPAVSAAQSEQGALGTSSVAGPAAATHLIDVVHARALRGWLEVDPLEPRGALGLAALHAQRSLHGATVGVASEEFIVKTMILQVETHGHTRVYPPLYLQPAAAAGIDSADGSAAPPGELDGGSSSPSPTSSSYNTTRAAVALWRALADLLGPLRVRDAPVPVLSASSRRGVGVGEGGQPATTAAVATGVRVVAGEGAPPPRPGTLWDRLYGRDPPWAPTDFERRFDDATGAFGVGVTGGAGGGTRGGGFPPEAPIPHPLLRGADRELWDDTLLDPSADPLLFGLGKSTKPEEGEAGMWCSDDEDNCVGMHHGNNQDQANTGEQEQQKRTLFLLQERARLASENNGGCLYYSPPPAAEEEIRSWIGGMNETREQHHHHHQQQQQREQDEQVQFNDHIDHDHDGLPSLKLECAVGSEDSATGTGSQESRPRRRPPLSEEIGVSGSSGRNAGESKGLVRKQEILEETDARVRRARGGGAYERGRGKGGKKSEEVKKSVGGRQSRSEETKTAAPEKSGRGKRQREGEQEQGRQDGRRRTKAEVADVTIGDRFAGEHNTTSNDQNSKGGDKKRRNLFSAIDEDNPGEQDADDVRSKGVVSGVDWMDGATNGNDDGTNEGGDEMDGTPDLREVEAPPGPPVGADAEATMLAETISVRLPSEEAVWVLASKCCIAAHLFGPQHRYCLEAIDRLCRNDVREAARPAREVLRKRGFRLQLSLARFAAANVRAAAAAEGHAGVAWGLPALRPGWGWVMPRDSYVPEFMSAPPPRA